MKVFCSCRAPCFVGSDGWAYCELCESRRFVGVQKKRKPWWYRLGAATVAAFLVACAVCGSL